MNSIKLIFLLACTRVLFASFSTESLRIPVHSFPFLSKQKFVEIHIEGKPYLALIDTGAQCSFMKKNVLSKIVNRDHVYDSEYMNFFGNKYLAANFQIPELKIGNFCIEAILTEEDESFSADCTVQTSSLFSWQIRTEAIIGMDVFQKFACIFDFPHSSIFLANEMSQIIENENFLTAEFHAVPFEMGKAGIILTFETDLGKKRLLLDAGSTLSAIRFTDEEKVGYNKSEFTTHILQVHSLDFSSWKFRVMDIAKEIDDMDGLLGIDFFNKNTICLDFPNRTALIQSPRLGSKERFTYWLKGCLGK